MRIFNGISNGEAEKLVQQAAQNITGRFYEEKEISQSIIDIVADALSLSTKELDDYDKEKSKYYKYGIIREMVKFSHKAKLTYGIVNPTEAFLIWLAIISGKDINNLTSEPINPEVLIDIINDEGKDKESIFFEIPKEDTQKAMGGLSITDCALARATMGLDSDVENTINKVLGGKVKDIFSEPNYTHFCLIDLGISMYKYVEHPVRRTGISRKSRTGLSYVAGIILEMFRNSSNNDIFIKFFRFFDSFTKSFEDTIAYEKTIKTDASKREFWMNFSPLMFNKDSPDIGVLIRKFLKSKDYLLQKNNKRVSLSIITDGSIWTRNGIRIAREINAENVKLNMFLLYDINEANVPDLFKMTSHVKDKNLFAFRNYSLRDITDLF